MKINGLMIDCSRLIERHEYYFKLLEFMSEWGMDILLFHFTDDFGCSIQLPGFEEIAAQNAFSIEEVKAFLERAKSLGIDVIPEIETFGHTRYLTDHPRYAGLNCIIEKAETYASLNALNPFLDESLEVVTRLLDAVATLFPSQYIHIGCDEVNMGKLPEQHGMAPDAAWVNYVNQVIARVHAVGRTPMMWADHLVTSDAVLSGLRKDVVLVDWRYMEFSPLGTDCFDGERFRKAGYDEVLIGPAIAMYYHRWLPRRQALKNVETCATLAVRDHLDGIIATAWIPFRYVQAAMYYGIAFAATAATAGGTVDLKAFNVRFAEKVFGVSSSASLETFLRSWPDLEMDNVVSKKMIDETAEFSEADLKLLEQNMQVGVKVLAAAKEVEPVKNAEIWQGMVLAAKAVYFCSLCYDELYSPSKKALPANAELILSVEELILQLDQEWDRTRFPDDPAKKTPKFTSWDEQYNLLFYKKLLDKLLSK